MPETPRSSADLPLLTLCALLEWFDEHLLVAVSERPASVVRALLSHAAVQPVAGRPAAHMLAPPMRTVLLAELRAGRHDLLVYHRRAVEHLAERARPDGDVRWSEHEEVACFYHLGELFDIAAPRRDWPTISSVLAALHDLPVQQRRHQGRLAYYAGAVAVRTHQLDQGVALLAAILEGPEQDSQLTSTVLTELGNAAWFQTRYDRALTYYRQAYALATISAELLTQYKTLRNMSFIYNELGFFEQALDLCQQSLAVARTLGDQSREAYALYELGNNSMELGRWRQARDFFQRATALYEGLEERASLMNVHWGQGLLLHLLGENAASERSFRLALAIAGSEAHRDLNVARDSLFQLGFLYETQRRWDEALHSFEEAIALAHQLGTQHELSIMHHRRSNVLLQLGRRDEALAGLVSAIEMIEALRGVTEGDDLKVGLLGTTQHLYEAMVRLCLERDRPDLAFDYAERARSRAFLDALTRKAPELHARVDQPVATLAEVQAQLPADALLIEYFTTGVAPRGEHLLNQLPPESAGLREHLSLPPQIIIFGVTRDRIMVARATLDPNSLRPQLGDTGPGRRLLHDHLLRGLYSRLIAPVGELLAGRRLLYLIPHGPLHYVPFMALRAPDGSYLLESGGPAIAIAPSATILLRNCLGRPRATTTAALALGYNDEADAGLWHAETEAHRVAHLLGGTAWTGPERKSERLLAAGPHLRWLHIACHALFVPDDPLASCLRLGAGDDLSARAIIDGLELAAELVTVSACTSGVSHVVPGDELFGLPRALLYAGAPAVVCTLWEAVDLAALLVMERLYTGLRRGEPAAAALREAQVGVRELTCREVGAIIARWRADDPAYAPPAAELELLASLDDEDRPFADPFYWAPFMLIGRPGAA